MPRDTKRKTLTEMFAESEALGRAEAVTTIVAFGKGTRFTEGHVHQPYAGGPGGHWQRRLYRSQAFASLVADGTLVRVWRWIPGRRYTLAPGEFSRLAVECCGAPSPSTEEGR